MAHRTSLQIAAALLGAQGWSCSVDLLHSTQWSNACQIDPESAACLGTTSSSGTGGEGGAGICGNGVVEAGEECDGGEDQPGCSACQIECSGAGEHLSPFAQSCYRLVGSTALEWSDALSDCEAWGGSLASITSSDEQLFVVALLSESTWIGGNGSGTQEIFEWASGEEWLFEAWADGEPSVTLDEDCVEMNQTLDFAWNNTICADLHAYLCERRPPGL